MRFRPLILMLSLGILCGIGLINKADAKVELIKPEVNINTFNPASVPAEKGFVMATDKGNIKILTDCGFLKQSAFITKLSDTYYKYGFTNVLATPQTCKVYLTSDIPINNYGCGWQDEKQKDVWICDHQFKYKNLILDFEDLLIKNPKMVFKVDKLNDRSYVLSFTGIKNFDPVVTSGGLVSLSVDTYTCETLNKTIAETYPTSYTAYINCTANTGYLYCKQNANIYVFRGGGLNITNKCVLSQNMGGDRTGTNSSMTFESGTYFEMSYAATYNSTNPAWESTIEIQNGTKIFIINSFLDELGQGSLTNRYGLNIRTANAYVCNTTFKDCLWCIVNNKLSCNVDECNAVDGRIENNTFSGAAVKDIVTAGASKINITDNIMSGFTNTAIETQTKQVGLDYNANELISAQRNTITGATGSIVGINLLNCDNCTIRSNMISSIKRNLDDKITGCISLLGNYGKILDNDCAYIGGTGLNEDAEVISLTGNYSYVNGSNIDSAGGINSAQNIAIKFIDCDYCTSENNVDLVCDSAKGASMAYYIDDSSDNNQISCRKGQDILDNNAKQVYGLVVHGSGNTIKNIKCTTYRDYGTCIAIYGNNNVFDNIQGYFTSAATVPDSVIDFINSNNNTIINSNLTVVGVNAGENNEPCNWEYETYAISGDISSKGVSLGLTYRNIALNTTYADGGWCADQYLTNTYQLERQWYLDVYVNDTDNNPLSNINVTGYNISDSFYFSELTQASGWIGTQNVTEYIQNHTTNTWFWTNYSINLTDPTGTYNDTASPLNITTNTKLYFSLQKIKDFMSDRLNLVMILSFIGVGGFFVYLSALHTLPFKLFFNLIGLFMLLVGVNVFTLMQNIAIIPSLLLIIETIIIAYVAFELVMLLYGAIRSVRV